MAKNKVLQEATRIEAALAGAVSGDPVVVGQLPGVALTSAADNPATNIVTVETDGVFLLSVKGIDGGGNSAVAIGDVIYHVNADTPKLSKKNTGVRFGYALDVVGSGMTATIRVKIGY